MREVAGVCCPICAADSVAVLRIATLWMRLRCRVCGEVWRVCACCLGQQELGDSCVWCGMQGRGDGLVR